MNGNEGREEEKKQKNTELKLKLAPLYIHYYSGCSSSATVLDSAHEEKFKMKSLSMNRCCFKTNFSNINCLRVNLGRIGYISQCLYEDPDR